MANKHYISIIRLFDHCGISIEGEFNLSRVKKQLQAEFGIAKDGFLEVDGYTYTRNDVFEELDQPDLASRLSNHKKLWEKPHLLAMLENNGIAINEITEEFVSLFGDREFDQFFSPYFAGPFQYASRTLLAEEDMDSLGLLMRFEDFLLPAEREEAFRPVRIFLEESLRTLRNVTAENYSIMRPKIQLWIDTNWPYFFNNLPDEFYEEKSEIVTKLINIGVAVQKSHKKDCKLMSYRLVALSEIPESLRTLISSNHLAYTESSSRTSVSSRTGFFLVWVVIMVLRGAFGDSCNSNSSDSYKNITPYQPLPTVLELSDSIKRLIYDSSGRAMLK